MFVIGATLGETACKTMRGKDLRKTHPPSPRLWRTGRREDPKIFDRINKIKAWMEEF
jgi:hypothetical protein